MAQLSYEDAVQSYALAILHETNREVWPFWGMLTPQQKLILWDEILRVMLMAEEFEKAADIQEEIEKIKSL